MHAESPSPEAALAEARAACLFVDLDGSLIKTDLLLQQSVLLLKRRPWRFVLAIARLAASRAAGKRYVASQVPFNPATLPYRDEVVRFLREERKQGRQIVLATASDRSWAESIQDHLLLFDDVIASDGQLNLKGNKKKRAIEQYCAENGYGEYAYLGDSKADIPIWDDAAEVILVAPSKRIERRYREHGQTMRILAPASEKLRNIARALRPHQWLKNLLVFVPIIAAHRWWELPLWIMAIIAFAAFSATASAIYVLNDLCDLDADRSHPAKRQRPFASGELPVAHGPALIGICLAVGFALAACIGSDAVLCLAAYFLLNVAYSFWLKTKIMVDVTALAIMYTARIIMGGLATDIVPSEWLLALALFLFTSLALGKRQSELIALAENAEAGDLARAKGRGYGAGDIPQVGALGSGAGMIAVLILALYINDAQAALHYRHPRLLWFLCPLLLYGIGRFWICVGRGLVADDPVLFTAMDWRTWAIAALSLLVLVAATY